MTDFPRYNYDSLYKYVWSVLEDEIDDTYQVENLTNRICDVVASWCPKKGDFWLNEDDDFLYVNKGWEVVTVDGVE